MLDQVGQGITQTELLHRVNRRIAVFLTIAFLSSLPNLVACARFSPPPATSLNPETFPQVLTPPVPVVPQELPPPVTENRTFVSIDGAPQYRIGPGDLLDVFITRGSTQERLQIPVRANGRISVSFV